MKSVKLNSIRIKNFKAIQDSGIIKLSPLTVFIGNNGSGKSSVIEGFQTLEKIVQEGLDDAVLPWHGFEHIWNQNVLHDHQKETETKRACQTNSMEFQLKGVMPKGVIQSGSFNYGLKATMGNGGNDLFIQEESLRFRQGLSMSRDAWGEVCFEGGGERKNKSLLTDGVSMVQDLGVGGLGQWQFLLLDPANMGNPVPQRRASRVTRLNYDGSNVAQYLLYLREKDPNVIDDIVSLMSQVLPYAADFQPNITSEIERSVYLQMTEHEHKIPGWLLSTGTLRVLALFSVLLDPDPPPLIVVEEIENGLDPRTIHLLVNIIREVVESKKTQVIITTHSPYLLDLVSLSSIVLVNRDDRGEPKFVRPGDDAEIRDWAKRFAPGKLYTTGRLLPR